MVTGEEVGEGRGGGGQSRGAPQSPSKGFGLIKVHGIFEATFRKYIVSKDTFLHFFSDSQSTGDLDLGSFLQRKGRLHWCFPFNELGKKPSSSKNSPCVSDHQRQYFRGFTELGGLPGGHTVNSSRPKPLGNHPCFRLWVLHKDFFFPLCH